MFEGLQLQPASPPCLLIYPHNFILTFISKEKVTSEFYLAGSWLFFEGIRGFSYCLIRVKNTRIRNSACRYWAVLFENLRRAVDDLYRTCEGDESCAAAKVLDTIKRFRRYNKKMIK